MLPTADRLAEAVALLLRVQPILARVVRGLIYDGVPCADDADVRYCVDTFLSRESPAPPPAVASEAGEVVEAAEWFFKDGDDTALRAAVRKYRASKETT